MWKFESIAEPKKKIAAAQMKMADEGSRFLVAFSMNVQSPARVRSCSGIGNFTAHVKGKYPGTQPLIFLPSM